MKAQKTGTLKSQALNGLLKKLKKSIKSVQSFCMDIFDESIGLKASSCAFFMFLSFIPMLLLLCSLLPLTGLNQSNLVSGLADIIPEGLLPVASSMIAEVYTKSGAVISVSALLTLWSAGKGVMALINAMNTVWEINDRRNFFVKRFIACTHTLLMLVLLIAAMLIMVFGENISGILLTKLPFLLRQVELIMAFRFIYGWIVFTIFFLILYRYLPGAKMTLKRQLPGSVFTGIAWSVFSYAFSLYITHFKPYGMYGSMGAIMLFMLWMYFCMYLIIIGAKINKKLSFRN